MYHHCKHETCIVMDGTCMYNCPTFFLFWKCLDDMSYWTNLYCTVADNELHFFTISNLNYTVFVSLAHKVSALPVEVEEKTTRGHNYKLTKKRCSTTRRLKFFSMRVVNAWNSLPVHVVNAVSVNSFKSRLDMCWAHIMFSTELPAHEQIC